MPGFGHLPEIFFLLLLALIVLGPKRMIEMGSTLGKAVRELREQVKDIPGMSGVANLGGLLGSDEPRPAPFATMSPFTQSAGAELQGEPPAPVIVTPAEPAARDGPDGFSSMPAASGAGPVIEGTIEPVETVEPAGPVDPAEPHAAE